MKRAFLALMAMSVLPANAGSVVTITSAQTAAQLFCSANMASEAIVIIAASTLKDLTSIKCPQGDFRVRLREMKQEDPGHIIANIDPPKGAAKAFDCDSKFDIGQKMVAFNCLRSSLEAKDHTR
jgi:hypothetical protein